MAALDSQQKRMAAAGIARPWMRAVFPVATPTEAWRISVGLAYPNALTPAAGFFARRYYDEFLAGAG